MATLLNTRTEERVLLHVQHTFGRPFQENSEASGNTALNYSEASRSHAMIAWDGDEWTLLDSSTNGTFVNEVRVASRAEKRLYQDDVINFGGYNKESWKIIDIAAPRNILLPVTSGLLPIFVDDIVVLPSEENPDITIYMAMDGGWVCESEAGLSAIKSGDLVGTQDCVWRFHEGLSSVKTKSVEVGISASSTHVQSVFDVSQNEEHVSLTIKIDDQEKNFGQRIPHYLILLLARKRIADQAAGIDDREQGWIRKELLSRMSGLDENYINIQVYRFRKSLLKVFPVCLEFIEKRRGEIRFTCKAIEINGGSQFASTP
ncbi:hypothetical protein A9Q99_24400 [Gammaproteobacteria bacterium 45_16_T64]|nr:hypothetical protein A9Q99_24400 [Gammaproteobacteria bacterium 45_16_T64]